MFESECRCPEALKDGSVRGSRHSVIRPVEVIKIHDPDCHPGLVYLPRSFSVSDAGIRNSGFTSRFHQPFAHGGHSQRSANV